MRNNNDKKIIINDIIKTIRIMRIIRNYMSYEIMNYENPVKCILFAGVTMKSVLIFAYLD